jgi:hypothetical protein
MSAKKPGFITGANAKIKMFDKTIAFVTDLSYNIDVQTIPIEAMGRYEAYSNEPVGYTVQGGFSVIRYTPYAKTALIDDVADSGNATSKIASGASAHFDPSQLLESETFDIEVNQKINETSDQKLVKICDCRMTRRGMQLNKRGVWVEQYGYIGLLLKDTSDAETDQAGNSGSQDLS